MVFGQNRFPARSRAGLNLAYFWSSNPKRDQKRPKLLKKIASKDANPRDIDNLLELTKQVEGHTICALGDAAAWPIQGLFKNFRDEIEMGLKLKKIAAE